MEIEQLLKLAATVRQVKLDEENTAHVTSMDGFNRERMTELVAKNKTPISYVVAVCLCDSTGKRLDPEGRKMNDVAKIPNQFLGKLFDAAMAASGLSDEEELEPNPNEGNGSS